MSPSAFLFCWTIFRDSMRLELENVKPNVTRDFYLSIPHARRWRQMLMMPTHPLFLSRANLCDVEAVH